MKLYEINADMRRALHELEIAEEQGNAEAYEQAMLKLGGVSMARDEKLSACCAYYRELESDTKSLEREIERLESARARAQKRLENWREYIGANLGAGEAWKNELFKLSWRKSEAVKVLDEKQIDPLYWRERTIREVDKKAIAQDLKLGATIPGAVLEVRQNLQLK